MIRFVATSGIDTINSSTALVIVKVTKESTKTVYIVAVVM